nr:hypothetical protein [Phycisphaerae bacterium]NIX32228.1 hypothetical protein [Phycisphaerae bacterium]
MKKSLIAILSTCVLVLNFSQINAGVVVLTAWEDGADICHNDPETGAEWFCGPFRVDYFGFTPDSYLGLATHPITHEMYAVLRDTVGAFHLIRFDVDTYNAYNIGTLGELITGLAFNATGDTLYGNTSDSAGGNSDSIFTIDIETAVATKIDDLPAPDGFGDTIAFNPNDGKLYHWGGYTTQSFNRLNLQTMTWENVGVP